MKKKIFSVTMIAMLSITSFIACNKSTNIGQNDKELQTSTVSSLIEDLDAIRSSSYTEHNNYLQSAFNAYNSGTLSTTYSLANLNSQLTWSESYFSSYITANSVMTEWTDIKNEAVNNYSSTNLAITNSFLSYQSYPSSDYKTYITDILDAISDISDGDPIDFTVVCANVYDNMKSDANLSTNEKELLAAIVGVAEGSHSYWDNNVTAWMQIAVIPTNLPNLPQNGGHTLRLSQKEGQVIGFVSADVMGALEGASAGSVLPGVGTAAGAVMGAALYSGLTAWFW